MSGTFHVWFFSSVWGHLVHFTKFMTLRFSKGYSYHSFHPILTKHYGQYGNQWVQLIIFWRSGKLKKIWRFEILCKYRTIWGWKFQNATPIIFIQSDANFMGPLATMVEYRLLRFPRIVSIIVWHFEILSWGSMQNF